MAIWETIAFYEQCHAAQGSHQEHGNRQEYSYSTVLQNYILEWLLDCISVSQHKDKLVLKGWLLIVLVDIESRITMKMDATHEGFPAV